MISNNKILALIPARSGSKGLPNKNIRELCGKPLIGWSIESCLNSKYIDSVVVSTDGEDIATISSKFGAEIPFIRPDYLARDDSSSVDVALHALDFLKSKKNEDYEYLILVEPTSPIRKIDDFDKIIEKLERNSSKYDSVITIGEAITHPLLMKKIVGSDMVPFLENEFKESRRQSLPKAFFPFGVAYLVKIPIFKKEKSFYTKKSTFYEIDRHQCYEIDDLSDFYAVENILKHREDFNL